MQQTSTNNNKHQRTSTNINKPSTNINWHAPRMEFVSPKVGQMLVDNWYNGAKGCSWSSDQDIFAIRMLQVRETSQFPRCAFGVVRKYDYDAILYKNISIHRYLCNMIAQICIYIYIHIAQERPIPIPSVIPLRCQDFYSRHAWPRVMEGLGHKKGGPKSFQHV